MQKEIQVIMARDGEMEWTGIYLETICLSESQIEITADRQ
jgi:hypothetical protein